MGDQEFYEAFGENYSLEVFVLPGRPGWVVVGDYRDTPVNSIGAGAVLPDFWAADAYATEFVLRASSGRAL